MLNSRSFTPFFITAGSVALGIVLCLGSLLGLTAGGVYTYRLAATLTPGVFDMALAPLPTLGAGQPTQAPVLTQPPAAVLPVIPAPSETPFIASPTAQPLPSETSSPQPTATQPAPPTKIPASPTAEFSATPAATATTESSPTPVPSATPTPLPTATTAPTRANTPTPDPAAISATQTAVAASLVQSMRDEIDKLYAAGLINSKNGVYTVLPDYEGEWAKTDEVRKDFTGYEPTNFVLRANARWAVDGKKGNWTESGCGVVLRETPEGNHYLVFLSLDGRARLIRRLNNADTLLGRSTIYDVDRTNGEASFMIVANEEWVRIFVNGAQKFEKRGDTSTGKLALAIVSGNSSGYGTYCKMTNVELWEIK